MGSLLYSLLIFNSGSLLFRFIWLIFLFTSFRSNFSSGTFTVMIFCSEIGGLVLEMLLLFIGLNKLSCSGFCLVLLVLANKLSYNMLSFIFFLMDLFLFIFIKSIFFLHCNTLSFIIIFHTDLFFLIFIFC